jgi:HlyD family secretion protein
MDRRKVVPVVVVLAAIGAGAWWWQRRGGDEGAATLATAGTVEATEARLGFEAGGRLITVVPREGDVVSAGSTVAPLDDGELVARRDQAAALLAAAEARLLELRHGARPEEVQTADAERLAAAERLADAERDLERTRTLFAGGAVAREALDKAGAARDVAAARVTQAAAQVRLVKSGPRREQIVAQEAAVAQARAALAAAEVALGRTVLRAAMAGLVTARHREPGEVVAPGAPVLSILDRSDRWVRTYVPEDRLAAVALGTTVTLRTDTFPGKTYAGRVVFLASEAEFTPKNVQTPEERVRLVYAAKVRIDGDPAFELKPGLPVDVELPLQRGDNSGGSAAGRASAEPAPVGGTT